MTSHTNRPAFLLLAALVLSLAALLTSCSDARQERARNAEPAGRYTQRELQVPQRYGGTHVGGTATGDTDRGASFARWVLEQDPERRYITDAVVRNDQVLGIKVQHGMTKDQLRELITALGRGMTRTYPGRPLVVNAFDQSGERLAEGVVDPRTGRVDVQFA
jgi:hypothetical protein